MSIGQNIKTLREHHDMTQEELAALVGTRKQTIYKYEVGIITNIPVERISAIASALHTTPAYLMGWEEAPEDTSSNKAKLKAIIEDMSEEQAAVLLAAFLSAKTAK